MRRAAPAFLVAALAASTACPHSSPPPRLAAEQPNDGGLPLPPPSTKRAVVSPSDVGQGEHALPPPSPPATAPR